MFRTYIGTQAGVYRLEGEEFTALGPVEHAVSAVYVCPGADGDEPDHDIVLAGTYGAGMFRSRDGGATWVPANQGLTAPALRTFLAEADALLCGAEPGRGFRSTDQGQSWQELTGITAVPGSEHWFLPYSPRAGALRNFYTPPGRPHQIFSAIEVGGLLYSEDHGESWTRLDTYDDDIHYVTGHPERRDEIWLALGWATLRERAQVDRDRLGGLARSDDGGQSWIKVIDHDYTRAVLVPPNRPDLVVAGPAKQVGRQGSIVVSADRGESWFPASDGIETPMADMVEQFVPAPDGSVWAICSGGRLLRAEPDTWHWHPVLPPSAPDVRARSITFKCMP